MYLAKLTTVLCETAYAGKSLTAMDRSGTKVDRSSNKNSESPRVYFGILEQLATGEKDPDAQ